MRLIPHLISYHISSQGRKCPSGCRIQGLLDQTNHELLKKIDKIRNLLDEGKKLHRSTDVESKNAYNYVRERLISSTGVLSAQRRIDSRLEPSSHSAVTLTLYITGSNKLVIPDVCRSFSNRRGVDVFFQVMITDTPLWLNSWGRGLLSWRSKLTVS